MTSTLSVSDPHDVDDLEVWLAVSHPRVADLQASLVGPNGVTVDLFHNVEVAGADLRGTVFADRSYITATQSITQGVAPFTGRYRPEGTLAAFAGEPMTGTWTLWLTDTVSGESGALDAWGLRIDTPPAQHNFRWDTLKSGFFGRSDNVVIRMIAYPQAPGDQPLAPGTFLYPNATAGPQSSTLCGSHNLPLPRAGDPDSSCGWARRNRRR